MEESRIPFVSETLKTSGCVGAPLRLLCFVNHTYFYSNSFQFVL